MVLPGMKILPDGWSEHHRPAAYGFLTGTCAARRPDMVGEWTPENPGGVIPGETVWDEKPCSVQYLSQHNTVFVTADSSETSATHRISVPIDVPALTYPDIIRITTNPDDPRLNGREFTVLTEETGTTNWTRDYNVIEINTRAVVNP